MYRKRNGRKNPRKSSNPLKLNFVPFAENKRLIDVIQSRKKFETELDDIIWEQGANDPRLAYLVHEIQMLRELEKQGKTND